MKRATVELFFHGQLNSYSVEVLRGRRGGSQSRGALSRSASGPRQLGPGVKRSVDWVRVLTTSGRPAVIDVVDDVRQGDLATLAGLARHWSSSTHSACRNDRSPASERPTFSGGLPATQHLLSLGHRRTGYLGSNAAFADNQAPPHGYRAALEAEGITVARSLSVPRNFLDKESDDC